MFSVNNFYNILASYYDYPKTPNAVMSFVPHGTKQWEHLQVWSAPSAEDDILTVCSKIVCHDQEPCFVSMLDTYRDYITIQKNIPQSAASQEKSELDKYLQILSESSGIETLHLLKKYTITPIICHSELNSKDIEHFTNHHFIECYYWWHGMIARDWFRHWEHHPDLAPYNKGKSTNRFLLYARDCTGTREYRNKVIDHFKRHKHTTLFNWTHSDVGSEASAIIDVNDATHSAVHVVAETLFETDKIHLTEKVFKPIVMSQPFLLFAAAGSLNYLKRYGFETFSEFWDESYDLIDDHNQRLAQVCQVIDYLASLSEENFSSLYEKMLPIIHRNRQRFFSKEFQEQLITEMHTNFKSALVTQQHIYSDSPGDPWFYYLDQLLLSKRHIPEFWITFLKKCLLLDNNLIKGIKKYPRIKALI